MFISKRQYTWLRYRLAEIEKAIEEHDDGLFDAAGKLFALEERVSALEEEAESVAEERKRERDFLDGFSNIMNYEVPYGRSQTQ